MIVSEDAKKRFDYLFKELNLDAGVTPDSSRDIFWRIFKSGYECGSSEVTDLF